MAGLELTPFLPPRDNQASGFLWIHCKHNTSNARRLTTNDAISTKRQADRDSDEDWASRNRSRGESGEWHRAKA